MIGIEFLLYLDTNACSESRNRYYEIVFIVEMILDEIKEEPYKVLLLDCSESNLNFVLLGGASCSILCFTYNCTSEPL